MFFYLWFVVQNLLRKMNILKHYMPHMFVFYIFLYLCLCLLYLYICEKDKSIETLWRAGRWPLAVSYISRLDLLEKLFLHLQKVDEVCDDHHHILTFIWTWGFLQVYMFGKACWQKFFLQKKF